MDELTYSSEIRNVDGIDWLYETWTNVEGLVMRLDCRRIEQATQVTIELVETHQTGEYTYTSEKVTDSGGVWLRERWAEAGGAIHMERNTRFQAQDITAVEPIEAHPVGELTYSVEKVYDPGGVWLRQRWTDVDGNVLQETLRRF